MNDEKNHQNAPTAENAFTEKARPTIRVGIIGLMVTIGVAGWTAWDTFVNRIIDRLSAVEQCCADYRAYKDEDSGQRHYWVDRIGENVVRVRDAEKETARAHARIDVLSSDAYIKPNAYRRSEGRELEKRIERLEAEVYK
jgi:hypothetical protein